MIISMQFGPNRGNQIFWFIQIVWFEFFFFVVVDRCYRICCIGSLLYIDLTFPIIEIYIVRVYIESINVSGFLFIIN